MSRILIAEDDAHVRQGLIDTLESEGYQVVAAAQGREAMAVFPQQAFDLVILDIMMPGASGYDVCREIRRRDSHVPVIFLSAKSEEIDKVIGLELGADDYVTKPFGIRELLARVAARLRSSRRALPTENAPPDEFEIGAAHINRRTYSGTVAGRPFSLTARELKLLEIFYAKAGEVLSRDALLNAAWGIDYLGTTRTLDQHICQLRKKIEPCSRHPTCLLTVHGIGYRYDPTIAAAEDASQAPAR
jgi:DNA-binding response OmpR family regulator